MYISYINFFLKDLPRTFFKNKIDVYLVKYWKYESVFFMICSIPTLFFLYLYKLT